MQASADEIRTSGGGSASPLWRQIQADMFQCPVTTVTGSAEGGAYGAALVAGTGVGIWSNLAEAVSVLQKQTEDLPKPENRSIYQELYEVYKGLYTHLQSSFVTIAKLQDSHI